MSDDQGHPGDERALAERAVQHDRQAFAQLYDRYVHKIYKYIYYKVGTIPQAEDLTAEVFLRAWEAIGGYRWNPQRTFGPWLFRIAHNLVVDHFRTSHPTVPIEQVPLGDGDTSIEESVQQRLAGDALQRSIAELTDDQQQVIILRFLEGYSTGEVARLIGKGEGAVRALQHRALQALQRILHMGGDRL